MKRAAKIVAIVLGVLLAGSALASAAAGNLASEARTEAEAEAEASADFGLEAVLEILGFVESEADARAEDAENASGEAEQENEAHFEEELVSEIDITAEGEVEEEQNVEAETPRAPEFPPRVKVFERADASGEIKQVFEMTAMADQTVVIKWDTGVYSTLEDQTTAAVEGPGYSGNLDLRALADASGGSSGQLEVSTHKVVAHMQEGEQLILETHHEARSEAQGQYVASYEAGADLYEEVRDQAHVKVDETISAYMGFKAEAQAETWSQAEWTTEKADFHEEVVADLTAQADSSAEMVLHSAGNAEGGASGEAESTTEAVASGSGGGNASPPVCDF